MNERLIERVNKESGSERGRGEIMGERQCVGGETKGSFKERGE